MNTNRRQRVYVQCIIVFFACTLSSCEHEDFFTYESPPSPEMSNLIEFELTPQAEGGESQSVNRSLEPILRAEEHVEMPDSCPGGQQKTTFNKTTFSGGGLALVLYTQSGFPIGFYQEWSEADPCDDVGPFYEIIYITFSTDGNPPFISAGQEGIVEVVHTFHPVPAVSFSTDLFRIEERSGEPDTAKINVQGRVYTKTLELN